MKYHFTAQHLPSLTVGWHSSMKSMTRELKSKVTWLEPWTTDTVWRSLKLARGIPPWNTIHAVPLIINTTNKLGLQYYVTLVTALICLYFSNISNAFKDLFHYRINSTSYDSYCDYRVSNRSAGMISSRFLGHIFTKTQQNLQFFSTFTGQGH